MGPCACISVCACLHTKEMFAMVFWLENWSTGQCACISVCACLHAANIFAMVLWLENWSTGQCACISVCVSACVQQTFLQRSCGWRIGPRDHVHACLLHASIHTRICMHVVPWTNSPTRITSQVCLREMILASMSSASKHAHTDMNARGPMDQFSSDGKRGT